MSNEMKHVYIKFTVLDNGIVSERQVLARVLEKKEDYLIVEYTTRAGIETRAVREGQYSDHMITLPFL